MTAIPAGTSTYTISASGATYSLATGQTRGGPDALQGVKIVGNNDVVNNNGTMVGGTQVGYGYFGGIAVYGAGVSVTNGVDGYIHGSNTNEAGIVFKYFGTIVNAGRIVSYGGPSGDAANGIDLTRGGTVTNLSTGTISGNGIFAGTYSSTPSTIVNSGVILGGNVYGGIYLGEGGSVTNLAGTISANGAAYGIKVERAAGTVTNAATIVGGITLASGFTNRVIADPGAVFSGLVDGGSGATLELAAGSGTGTVSAVSSNFTNFSVLTLDSGASWVIDGGSGLASAFATIAGFGTTDSIQLSGHDSVSGQSSGNGLTHITLTGTSPMVLNFQGSVALQASYGSSITTLTEANAPTVSIALVNDTSNGHLDTSDDALKGTGADNTMVTFTENGSNIGSTTSDGSGNWTFTPTNLAQGSNTITATEINSGGTGTATITFTYDTVAPDVSISLVNDTSHGSLDTSDDELKGGGDPNATVIFKENGSQIGTTTADGSGGWTFTPTSLGQGSNTITAFETDGAGNTGSAAITFTYDTVAPDVTISLVNDTSHGSLDTSDDELQGGGDPNATVTFKENGSTVGSTIADASGAWTFMPSGLGQGANTITAFETDAAGNTGSAAITFTYDTVAPDVTVQLVSGTNPTNNPDIEGTGDPNATVTIQENGSTIGTTNADASGNWQFDPTGLSSGSNTLVASETDLAGNTGSASITFTLETTVTFDAHVYLDTNGDGTQDGSETGLAGVTVNLLDGSGNPLGPTAVTDSSGDVSFTGLNPGSYEVGVVVPAGDVVSQATNIDTPNTLSAGQTAGATEGVYVPATFSVHVYDDVNADGSQDDGESGFQGLTVNLLNASDQVIAATTTDANGNGSFIGLAPGSYEVQVVTPAGDAASQAVNVGTLNTLESGGSASATVGLYAPPALSQPTINLTDAEGQSLGNLWSMLVANGVDPNASSLTISAVNTSRTQGYVSYTQSTQTLTYLATGFNPSQPVDSFTYTLKDAAGGTVTGTVDITITGANLPTTVATTPNSTTTATGSGQRLISQGSGQTLASSPSGGDELFGGTNTTIDGAGNGNMIYVEPGNHLINMGASNNTATVGDGNNTISATGTGNTVNGGNGSNTITGMTGSATITLGNGNNSITVIGANNSITVGGGNNTISAGTGGTENVQAGGGNNTISAGGPNDVINVGNGTNKISATGADATITVGNGGNTIAATGAGDSITLGSGNDTVADTVGGATIKAGIGTDSIRFAGSGSDVINQGGSDTLTDTGTNNTIALAANGLDTITGSVLGNGDTFDLRAALAATNWDGQLSNLGSYLSMGTQGSNATVLLSSTSGGGGVTIGVLNGAGSVSLSTFLAHALT
ncbi:MAG TPA: SdrD B-like domain-containing protein [Acetobacteraceae bacterium]|nr:SdrD B-like domain-containing protein [Acetobacteraceae bacterium]